MKNSITLTVFLAVLLGGCTPSTPEIGTTVIVITAEVSTVVPETPGLSPTAGPSPTPVPATPIPALPSSSLSPAELKYRVLEQFPDFFFCDPDYYPVARADEMELAQARFPQLQVNQEAFQVILSHTGLSGNTTFTNDQKLLIYREYKKLNALHFELAGNVYQFQIQTGTEGQQGSLISGSIDGNGSIEIVKREQGFPTCPICLAAGTLIDTPRGLIPVEELIVGDPIWTMNESGERVLEKIAMTSRVPVPASHQVIHVTLSDGREVWASPGHPTADGRTLGELQGNDLLDGVRVIRTERLPYAGTTTYDILPSGETGYYWANGILMGSTLSQP